ncbi:hypothetical protein ABI59_01190 [Acidobacteria bacterium Mor1]|nr:hypothetical protein ABI59_01190 [Acidobacteria bacterium Mor1]
MLLVVLLFGQLLLMAADSRGRDGASLLERGMMRVTSPVVSAARWVGGSISGLFRNVRELREARRENTELRARVNELRLETARQGEYAAENGRLRRLLGMREDLFPDSIGARVVTATLSTDERVIVIDRGTDDGVHIDLPVVAWGGAVGRVISANASHAKVRLLTDPRGGVGAIVQRSRVKGIALGNGEVLELEYVSQFSDVALGDRVVTSGQDGVFPKGLGIGVVSLVQGDQGISKLIHVEPEVDLESLEEVLVLLEPVGGPLLEVEVLEEGA